MTIRTLLDRFDLLMDTPESVSNLRRFILRLAVEGRLTRQKTEESASSLLNRIQSRKQKLLAENDSPRRKSLGEMTEDFPFDLPQNWIWTRLDDVCPYIQRGKRPDYSERKEIPVVSQKCVQWDGFKSDRVRFIDPESLDKYQSYRFLKKGDLLWNSTGVGTVGRVNVYRGELDEYPRAVADSHVTVVRPIKEMVLPEYIYCWIGSTHIQSKVETEMTSGTTKQTELNTSTVRRTLLPLPPVEEQQRIAETVDQLMDECDALEQQQERERTLQVQMGTAVTEALQSANDAEALRPAWERVREHFDTVTATTEAVDALRQTILQLAVRGWLSDQKESDEPAQVLLGRMEDEKERLDAAGEYKYQKTMPPIEKDDIPFSFSLPKGWTWVRLGSLGKVYGGGTPKKSNQTYWGGKIPWVSPKDMNGAVIHSTEDQITQKGLKESSAKLIPPESLLIVGRSGILERKLPVGVTAVECTANQDLKVLTPFVSGMARYIRLMLKGFEPYILDELVKTGTTVRSLKYTEFQLQSYPLPPIEEQQRIIETVQSLMSFCNHLRELLSEAGEHGEQLLEAALNGVAADTPDRMPVQVAS